MRTFRDILYPWTSSNGHETTQTPIAIPETVRRHVNHEVPDRTIGSFFLVLPVVSTRTVAHAMRRPLRRGNALVLGTYMMLLMAQYTSASMISMVSDGIGVLSVLCKMPLISTVPMCGVISKARPFTKLVEQQMRLVTVMDSTSVNADFALELFHTEMAVKDLNAEVEASDIESKDTLVRSLNDIAAIAKQGNHQLIVLQSGIGNAVDCILAMDEWAVESLKAIQLHKTRIGLSAFIFGSQVPPPSRGEIIEKFNEIASLMEAKLHRLISMAEITVITLNNLQSGLEIGQWVHLRTGEGKQRQRGQGLATMWKSVGQNRHKLASYTRNLKLLSNFEKRQSKAALKVGEILVQLLKLQEDLDNLRRDVQPPRLQRAHPQFEITLKTLRKGVERLSEARAMARNTNEKSRERMFSHLSIPEL